VRAAALSIPAASGHACGDQPKTCAKGKPRWFLRDPNVPKGSSIHLYNPAPRAAPTQHPNPEAHLLPQLTHQLI
jgi:hypothetical protein